MKLAIIPDRVKQLAKIKLYKGAHETNDEMCAMEAVAWIAGEEHSDQPACASPVIAAFVRRWNDDLNDEDRERLIKPLIPRLVGTRGTPEQERQRSLMALEWHNGVMLPAFLDLVEELKPHAEAVRKDPLNPTVILFAVSAAGNAARAAAGNATKTADWYAAWDAAGNATKTAAGNAAWAATWAARGTAWTAAGNAARTAAVASNDALTSTVITLQTSALDLLDRMINTTERADQ